MSAGRASISECGLYRYDLTRQWDRRGPWAMWLMLNPSTADAEQDDPTIRRCIGFSRAGGYAGMVVCNLYAYRTPSPADLVDAAGAGIDPVGPENDRLIGQWLNWPRLDRAVCAWGASPIARSRQMQVLNRVLSVKRAAWCLGLTRTGAPRHPLYIPSRQPFELLAEHP